jgi:hypothetical protein
LWESQVQRPGVQHFCKQRPVAPPRLVEGSGQPEHWCTSPRGGTGLGSHHRCLLPPRLGGVTWGKQQYRGNGILRC